MDGDGVGDECRKKNGIKNPWGVKSFMLANGRAEA